MQELAALLVLALNAATAQTWPDWLRQAEMQAAAREANAAAWRANPPAGLAAPAPLGQTWSPPPCSGDVCQPRVALPGYKPRFTAGNARTQLTLKALDATGLEPAASLAWWLASTGLRFEYVSATMDAAATGSRVGLRHYQVVLGYRLDAFGDPESLRRDR
jgi:hypothetical protein